MTLFVEMNTTPDENVVQRIFNFDKTVPLANCICMEHNSNTAAQLFPAETRGSWRLNTRVCAVPEAVRVHERAFYLLDGSVKHDIYFASCTNEKGPHAYLKGSSLFSERLAEVQSLLGVLGITFVQK